MTPQWSVSFTFSNQSLVSISQLPQACYMSRPSLLLCSGHRNITNYEDPHYAISSINCQQQFVARIQSGTLRFSVKYSWMCLECGQFTYNTRKGKPCSPLLGNHPLWTRPHLWRRQHIKWRRRGCQGRPAFPSYSSEHLACSVLSNAEPRTWNRDNTECSKQGDWTPVVLCSRCTPCGSYVRQSDTVASLRFSFVSHNSTNDLWKSKLALRYATGGTSPQLITTWLSVRASRLTRHLAGRWEKSFSWWIIL